jgi:hypothetical protein
MTIASIQAHANTASSIRFAFDDYSGTEND